MGPQAEDHHTIDDRNQHCNSLSLSLSLSLSQPVTPAEVRNAIKISPLNRSTGPTGLMGKDTELAPPAPGPKPPRRHIPLEVFKYISSLAYRRHIVKRGEATNTVTIIYIYHAERESKKFNYGNRNIIHTLYI